MLEFQILEELRQYLPPLKPEELAQLEANILEEGTIKEALTLAQVGEELYLADGHNRHAIATKHGLEFKTVTKTFANLYEVKAWMLKAQFGKRNLNDTQTTYSIGKQYLSEKKNKRGKKITGQNVQSNETRERIAAEYKISPKTVQRAADFAKCVDALTPEARALILRMDTKVTQNELKKVVQAGAEAIAEFCRQLTAGEKPKRPSSKEPKPKKPQPLAGLPAKADGEAKQPKIYRNTLSLDSLQKIAKAGLEIYRRDGNVVERFEIHGLKWITSTKLPSESQATKYLKSLEETSVILWT